MSKKTINIKLFLGILLAIVLLSIWIFSNIKEDRGNVFSMSIPGEETSGDVKLKGVTLYVDFSGSMRGFLDGKNSHNADDFKDFKASMISNVSNGLTNLAYTYSIQPQSICGDKKYDNKSFINAMSNLSVFNANSTLLNEMLSNCIGTISDSTVGILVSDMVLSYGKKKLAENKYFNKQHLSELSGKIYDTLMGAKKDKRMHVILLQYLSDYNGKFYCNYTENNVPNDFDTVLMKKRPYYVLICGTESNLRSIMKNGCFKNYDNVYASFLLPEPKKQSFEVKVEHPEIWSVGSDTPNDNKGVVWTDGDEDYSQEVLTICCDAFRIPRYVKANPDLEFSKDVFSRVKGPEEYTYTDGGKYTFSATLQPYGKLHKNMDASILIVTNTDWMESSSEEDDTKVDALSFQGKTWGFYALANEFAKVYISPKKQVLAKIEFVISSK